MPHRAATCRHLEEPVPSNQSRRLEIGFVFGFAERHGLLSAEGGAADAVTVGVILWGFESAG